MVNEVGRARVEYRVSIKSMYNPRLFANNVTIRIPTPPNTAKTNIRLGGLGKAKYDPADNAFVWK